jgi:hypothetical protein
MTTKEKLIFEIDKILVSVPKGIIIRDYVFVCSKDFECEITQYKDINIFYHNWVKENTIYYMENPYFDTEKL